jgi:hypothetical protein
MQRNATLLNGHRLIELRERFACVDERSSDAGSLEFLPAFPRRELTDVEAFCPPV